jgi:hypothetical protein
MTEAKTPGSALRVLELFEEGTKFTEELLKENERLRLLLAKSRVEKMEMEGKTSSKDQARIEQKLALQNEELEQLRTENQELKDQYLSVEEENRVFADRYINVERQNSDLISLYVASYRLHSTLEYNEVLQIVTEIVINMIGAEVFGVYVIDEKAKCLELISQEGFAGNATQSVPLGVGVLGEAAAKGDVYIAPAGTDMQTVGSDPIACIPLKVGERNMGVIAIYRLLLQKDMFQEIDFQLFELLGGHAATAIYVAKLYSISERKRSTLEGFIDMLRSDMRVST